MNKEELKEIMIRIKLLLLKKELKETKRKIKQ